ncbi:PqiC family protein [Thiorhodovibrio winogradskyi]|uniref:PqiC family protein n=1 Tax=Thiorhodovibrio winogradskyi TaxID=77007 RepID=UPI002E2A8413|nr:PqiC family protein [Thiorhodovibrio winogradskyi]
MRGTQTRGIAPALFMIAALPWLLGSCASSPPSAFYTLEAMAGGPDGGDQAIQGGRLAVGLGPVSFPRFLDRPQVVQRQGGHQLRLDEFHRWGGSLDDDFLRVFAENLAQLLQTSRVVVFPSELRMQLDFRVMAEVVAFEAGPSDQALLKVRWAVLDPFSQEVLSMREDSYRKRLPANASVSQQVAALSAALADFSRDVADELRRLPKPKPLGAELAGMNWQAPSRVTSARHNGRSG